MLQQKAEHVTAETLERLVADRRSESRTLEFKAKLPGNSDAEIKEFLKDVAAMANSAGGDIIYGVGEADGVADSVQPEAAESADNVVRRLSQRLDDCIEPRLHGCRLIPVDVEDGFALVIRIPQSLIGPHRTTYKGQERFPIRNDVNTNDMSYDQLRTAFDRSASLAERARQFREKRVDLVLGAEVGTKLVGGGSVLVHVLPLQAMAGTTQIDVRDAYKRFGELVPDGWNISSRTMNLDGVLVFDNEGGRGVYNYVQLYRSGAMEYYCGSINTSDQNGRQLIPSAHVAEFVRNAIRKGLAIPRAFGVSGGAFVAVSVLGVEGRSIYQGRMFAMTSKAKADRANLVLPEHWVEDISDFELDDVARPILDVLWQSFGLQQCIFYEQGGVFNPDLEYH
jgi:hypothetical protein